MLEWDAAWLVRAGLHSWRRHAGYGKEHVHIQAVGLTFIRSRLTSLLLRSATAKTALTHISAMSRLHLPTLQAHAVPQSWYAVLAGS